MGDSASQPNAQSLRNLLVGLSRFEQFPVAIQWARENHLPHLLQPPHKGRLAVIIYSWKSVRKAQDNVGKM